MTVSRIAPGLLPRQKHQADKDPYWLSLARHRTKYACETRKCLIQPNIWPDCFPDIYLDKKKRKNTESV